MERNDDHARLCDRRKSWLREQFRRRGGPAGRDSESSDGKDDATTRRTCDEEERNNKTSVTRRRRWLPFRKRPCGVRNFRSPAVSGSSVCAYVSSTKTSELTGTNEHTLVPPSPGGQALNPDRLFRSRDRQASLPNTRATPERMISFLTRSLLQAPSPQHATRRQSNQGHHLFGIGSLSKFDSDSQSSFDSTESPIIPRPASTDQEGRLGNVYHNPTAFQLELESLVDVSLSESEEIYGYLRIPVRSNRIGQCDSEEKNGLYVRSDDIGSSDSKEIYGCLRIPTYRQGNSGHYQPNYNLTQRQQSRTLSLDSAIRSVPDVDRNFTGTHAPGSCQATASADPPATNRAKRLGNLGTYGWYWGPVTAREAEQLLEGRPDGTFLLRDSSHDRYFFSLTFRSQDKTCHMRVERFNGCFSFCKDPIYNIKAPTIARLINVSMRQSKVGPCGYFKSGAASNTPVRLVYPFSRFS